MVNVCEFFECEIPVIENLSIAVLNLTYLPLMSMNFSLFRNVCVLHSSEYKMVDVPLQSLYLRHDKRVFSSRYISF